jgi:hypothetical protein
MLIDLLRSASLQKVSLGITKNKVHDIAGKPKAQNRVGSVFPRGYEIYKYDDVQIYFNDQNLVFMVGLTVGKEFKIEIHLRELEVIDVSDIKTESELIAFCNAHSISCTKDRDCTYSVGNHWTISYDEHIHELFLTRG